MSILLKMSALTYPVARRLLFKMDAERAHHLTLKCLSLWQRSPFLDFPTPTGEVEVMGLKFPNRLGLAAGMDKTADCIDGFGALGFGHVEVGTLTPRAQPGNPKPRLFRIREREAIINRMGFNNPGIEAALESVSRRRFPGILGINVGKNFDTPNERAVDDYLTCFTKAYPFADYLTINLSSPNTQNLRELQLVDHCRPLLQALVEARKELRDQHQRHVPIAVKIAPDLEFEHLDRLAELLTGVGVEAVVATNTTLDRAGVAGKAHAEEAGGLSGAPLKDRSTAVIARLYKTLGTQFPIIGVGGIMTGEDAVEKLEAGAALVQIYTGLVYKGPSLIADIIRKTHRSKPPIPLHYA